MKGSNKKISSGPKAWICPACKRPFKSRNQWHSCVNVDPGLLMENRPPALVKACRKMLKAVEKMDGVMITAATSAIFAKAPSTFLALKFYKDHLKIEFFLDRKTEEFPVIKTLQLSKTRIVHEVAVENEKEVNEQIINWVKRSYNLIRK